MSFWSSPAKINLFLHILGRREDGYHQLQTAFQFLDYSDELEFTLRTDGKIFLSPSLADIPLENNLIYRAATLLQTFSGTQQGIDIYLKKRLPIGAGLGGGSSNAATTLVALNELWRLEFSATELLKIGLQLGADVPIFIAGKAAFAEGVGEILTPLSLQESWFVVLTPPLQISTAEIFSLPELTRNTQPITIQEFSEGSSSLQNDCEAIVKKRYPLIAQGLDWLNLFAPAKLTGTGSSVFASVIDYDLALSIVSIVPKPFAAFAAKGLNVSPLLKVRS